MLRRTIGVVLCCLFLPGCSLFAPGSDVRTATESKNHTVYDKDSQLFIREDTTHNRSVVVAEGGTDADGDGVPDGVTVEYSDDGTGRPKKIENATHVLTQVSEPKDASTAYMQVITENARFGREVLGLVKDVVDRFVPGGGSAESQPANDRESRLDRLERLLQQVIASQQSKPK